LGGPQIFHLALACLQFAAAGDQGRAKAALVGVLQLLADLSRLRVHLDAQARAADLARQAQVIVQVPGVEEDDQHVGRRPYLADHAQFFHRRQQSVQPQRRANAGQILLGIQAREVVVAAARTDAADVGQGFQKGLEDRPGVVVQSAGNRHVQRHVIVRHARGADPGQNLRQARDSLLTGLAAGDQRLHLPQNLLVGARQSGQPQHIRRLLGRRVRSHHHLVGHPVRADLRQLVQSAQDRRRLVAQSQPLQQAVQHAAVVDADRKTVETDRAHQVVDHQHRLDVGRDAARADRVKVALHELAIAAALGVFAAPHRGDVVAFERRAQLADVLGHEASQRHRQIEPHADLAPTMILEPVQLAVRLVAALAGQHFQVLQRRRIDGTEAVRRLAVSISRSRGIIVSGK